MPKMCQKNLSQSILHKKITREGRNTLYIMHLIMNLVDNFINLVAAKNFALALSIGLIIEIIIISNNFWKQKIIIIFNN